uniref:Uncharacterized protein n=1 Tax=Hyaloperonospora arabidopsidis (strain Emoy2) TaxID=559515 RepID=M4B9R3_HYAAE
MLIGAKRLRLGRLVFKGPPRLSPASPGPPTIRCRGFMLLREPELSRTGVPKWCN